MVGKKKYIKKQEIADMIEKHENNFFIVHQGEKHRLKLGDLLTVPWGKASAQMACVVKITETNIHIKKYKASSGEWAKVSTSLPTAHYEKTKFNPGQFANRGLLVNKYNLGDLLLGSKND